MRRIPAMLLAACFMTTASWSGENLKVGREVTLPANGPKKGLQVTPDVAHGQGVYLAVWREGWNGEGGASRIRAARLDKNGKLLDPKGIAIPATGKGMQERPRVTFGGGVFLVVWQAYRDGKQYDVLGARISPKGKVLDARPLAISAGPHNQALPDVASNGLGFVVVWQSVVEEKRTPAYFIFASPVSSSGTVGPPLKLCGGESKPLITWTGTDYIVVFAHILQGIRVSAAGKPTGKKFGFGGRPPFRENTRAVAGDNEKGWLVIADRAQPDYWGWGGSGGMRCFYVGASGKMDGSIKNWGNPKTRRPHWLDFAPTSNKKEGDAWPFGHAAVAWDGKRFVVVWERQHVTKKVMLKNSDLIGSRVDGWKPLDPAGVPIAAGTGEEKSPALASDGAGNLLCVYAKYGQKGVSIIARLLRTK